MRNLDWRRHIRTLWGVVFVLMALIGTAGLLDDISVWRKWLEGLGIAELPLANPLVSGMLIGGGSVGLLSLVVARWGERIAIKYRWTRIHLRDTFRRVESAILGVPVRYWFENKTTNVKYRPKGIRLRVGQSSIIPLSLVNHSNHDVEMHLEIRGDRYHMIIAILDFDGLEQPVPRPLGGWSRHFGSHHFVNLQQFQQPREVRIRVEHRAI